MQISGTNTQYGNRRTKDSYYFSIYNRAWGWASWRRAWNHYDVNMTQWEKLKNTNWLEYILRDKQAAKNWSDRFQWTYEGTIDTWDHQWKLDCWMHNGLSIIPSVNLVTNIGFGAEGTHCLDQNNILANIPQEKKSFPLKHPHLVERHLGADEFEETTLYSVRETKKLERIKKITPDFDTTIFPIKKHFVPEFRVIKIAHIINPVIVNESSDLHIAQPITLATMKTAQQQAEGKVDVTIYTAQYPEDRAIIPEGFIQTPDLDRSILDIAQFQNPRKLPLIKDILDRLYEAAPEADYLIYTNADIALQPHFYTEVAKIIEEGYDAFVINRRTIPDHYKDISEIPQMYAEKGEPHPGHDCFIFKRSLYEKSYLENHVIGVGFCFRPMFLNCLCHGEKFQEFRDLHLTFHIGNQETWKDSKLQDYLNHNKNEAQKIFDYYLNQNLLPNHPLIEERFDLFAKPLSSPTPSVELPADATAKDYYQLGQKLEKEKQLERALKAYQKAIEIDPNNSWYHHNLANVFRKQNQIQQAITAYENAIKINPKFSWSHYHLGCLLEQQGKIQESISAYQTAVELYPNFKVYQSKLESLTKLAK